MKVAVVAHAGKTLGGGLPELRRVLEAEGVHDPLWVEVPKSRKAPKRVRRLLGQGADHFVVWGGDGMAQRCIDTLAATDRCFLSYVQRGLERGAADERIRRIGFRFHPDGAISH